MTHSQHTPPDLDPFESRLLTELRAHVAAHPTSTPSTPSTPSAPSNRPRGRRPLWALGGVAAAATVAAAVVVGVGPAHGPAAAAAFAVTRDSHGDVTVTVHRLDDAAGLQRALRADGIDADVSYDSGSRAGDGYVPHFPQDPGASVGPQHERIYVLGPSTPASTGTDAPSPVVPNGKPTDPPGGDPADGGACGSAVPSAATLTHQDGDWVLDIPADSPLQDRHVFLGTDASGTLVVTFAGRRADTTCSVVSLGQVHDDGQG